MLNETIVRGCAYGSLAFVFPACFGCCVPRIGAFPVVRARLARALARSYSWKSETRGRLREQGVLAQVKELTKQIRTAAKANKREWLDQQLETGDWQPITNLKQPFVQKVLRLQGLGQGQEDCTDSNAEVYAQHLAHV